MCILGWVFYVFSCILLWLLMLVRGFVEVVIVSFVDIIENGFVEYLCCINYSRYVEYVYFKY